MLPLGKLGEVQESSLHYFLQLHMATSMSSKKKKKVVSHIESSVNWEERLNVATTGMHIPEIVLAPFVMSFTVSHWTQI